MSCSGVVVDQPARLMIASLGDHRLNNNVVSGFFTVSLVRASDGALLTNATGSDVIVLKGMAKSMRWSGKLFCEMEFWQDVRLNLMFT